MSQSARGCSRVGQFEMTIPVDEDVLWLHISMDKPHLVQIMDAQS